MSPNCSVFFYFTTGLWQFLQKLVVSDSNPGEVALLRGSKKQKTLKQKSWHKLIILKASGEMTNQTHVQGTCFSMVSIRTHKNISSLAIRDKEGFVFFPSPFWPTSVLEHVVWPSASITPSHHIFLLQYEDFWLPWANQDVPVNMNDARKGRSECQSKKGNNLSQLFHLWYISLQWDTYS